jgi:cell volume regulation protein A
VIEHDMPAVTALALAVGGLLLAVSCLLSKLGAKLGVPASLLFLVVGMLAGSEGLGHIWFDRFDWANLLGTLALVSILYAGGLQTPVAAVRGALGPASVLATGGVLLVAGLTALFAHLLGIPWGEALLIGAIVSSTDAAAVFAVLHGTRLPARITRTIELESGLNDPVAVILTMAMTANLLGLDISGGQLVAEILQQLVVGAGCGLLLGWIGRTLLEKYRLANVAMHPVLSLAFALMAYGVPTSCGGSGFLAVYLAGIVIGNSRVAKCDGLVAVHDSMAWLAQVSMFLMLGLLVVPSQLPPVADEGLLIAVFLAFVARPVAVAACLLPFGFRWREIACISWVGLRGAVPIVMATVPVLCAAGRSALVQEALDVFDLVFFIVVVGSIVPGATVRWLTRKLGVEGTGEPADSHDSPHAAPPEPPSRVPELVQ